jgi:hypothetical protein
VNTISTPTALNVSLLSLSTWLVVVMLPEASVTTCAAVLVSWYMVTTGITRRQNITNVMRMLTSLSMRELL